MSKKRTAYKDARLIFQKRGLVLDTTENEFEQISLSNVKLKCHCMKHPSVPLEYYFTVVKSGRFGCKECKKESSVKRRDMSLVEKVDFIKSRGYTYISGDLSRVLNPLLLVCPQGHECRASINDLFRMDCVCNICNGRVTAGYWTVQKCQDWIDGIEEFKGYVVLEIKGDRVCLKCPVEHHSSYWTSWQHVYTEKTICRECYYNRENKSFWDVNKAKHLLAQYGYTMVDDTLYVSSHCRVPCYDAYGFVYMASVHYIQQGRTKFSLWKNNPYAVHNINLYCKLFRPDYEFVSQEYYGNKEFHTWKYTGDCIDDHLYDREFELKFGAFVNGNCGHPMLSKSKLEAKCQSILDKYKLMYKTQKTFEGCVYKHKLRFDFYLVLDGKEICIETDGNQHIYPAEKFGGLEGLAERQKCDRIKTQYCLDHDIILIRIPESKFKYMEDILIKELNLNTRL